MHFNILDTESAYRRMLDTSNPDTRETIFREELAEPYTGLAQVFGQPDPVAAMAMWNMKADQFALEHHDAMWGRLDVLANANTFDRATQALEKGWAAFGGYQSRIRHDSITFGLHLCDLSALPMAGGYSGFGAVPGWIMTLYDTPTAENLKRVEACTVHELHHNLAAGSDSGINFNMMTTTVGDYLVMEGLAEAFAAELYGDDMIGPWVTEFDATLMESTRIRFRDALHLTGFNTIRQYIFGDDVMARMSGEAIGIPRYAGYALGYHVVRAYQLNTGKNVVETTYTSLTDILTGSRFFD